MGELVLAINAALADSDRCPAADTDRDGSVTVAELVDGVARGLFGCFQSQGSEAVEEATRIEETTRDTLPGLVSWNFGQLGAFPSASGVTRRRSTAAAALPELLAGGGAGQAVPQPCTRGDPGSGTILTTCNRATNTLTTTYAQCRLPGESAVLNGIDQRSVVVPGNPDFDFCASNSQVPDNAIETTVLTGYSELSPSGGIRLANLTQRFEPSGQPCRLSSGEVFANGTLTTDGFLNVFCNPQSAGCDASLADLRLTATALTLRLTYAQPGCDLRSDATGKLFVDNRARGESFAQTFMGLTLNETVVGDRRTMSQNGRVFVDCLGEVEYSMPVDLVIEPGEACPTDGQLRIVIRDPSAGGALAEPGLAHALAPEQRAALSTPPNSQAVSGGLYDHAYRAANGQVYQVLQNPAGNRELQTEDVQVTTVIGSTDGINQCASISMSQTQAQAVVSSVPGFAFPIERVFVSPVFEAATAPCFNPNGSGGDGLLCFGEACNSADCRCPSGGCNTYSLTNLTPLAGSPLSGRLVDSLPGAVPPCGGSTYGFGTDNPTVDPGLCATRPADGFDLQPQRSIVFAYDAPPTSEFIAGAGGFLIDVGGDGNRCHRAGAVVTGVATKNELGKALVTFTGGRVDFDVNDDKIAERSVPSCQMLSASQCGAPAPTPMPTPNRPCPDFPNRTLPDSESTADSPNVLGGASCGDGGNSSPERSYRFRAPEDGCYQIDTLGSDFDTLLYVRRGGETCQGAEVACNDNADPSTLQSVVLVPFERDNPARGDTAVIVVDGSGGQSGTFRLNATRIGQDCPNVPPTSTDTPSPTSTLTPTDTPSPTPTRPLNVWISNGPAGGPDVRALAVDPVSSQTVYAGTFTGVFKSTNGGTSWSEQNSGLTELRVQALAIDPATPQIVYAGMFCSGPPGSCLSTTGGVFKTSNGAATWSAASSGLTDTYVQVLAIDPVNPRTIYAGTRLGVFKSVNGGDGWSPANNGLESLNVQELAIDPVSPQTLYAATGSTGVFKSTNGGESWEAASSGLTSTIASAFAIDPASPQTLYVATGDPILGGGGVFKSTNGAQNWSLANSGLPGMASFDIVIDPVDSQTLYVPAGIRVFKTTNGAAGWSAITTMGFPTTSIQALAVDPTNPQTLYVGTFGKGVFRIDQEP